MRNVVLLLLFGLTAVAGVEFQLAKEVLAPCSVEDAIRIGDALLEAGDFDNARRQLKCLKKDAEAGNRLHKLGREHGMAKRMARSAFWLMLAIKTHPSPHTDMYFDCGISLSHSNQNEKAAKHFEYALKQHPQCGGCKVELVGAYYRLNRIHEVHELCQRWRNDENPQVRARIREILPSVESFLQKNFESTTEEKLNVLRRAGEATRRNMKDNSIVIAFYHTTDPVYSSKAKRLERSLQRLNLEYDVRVVSQPDRKVAISGKADFILQLLEQYQKPVMYVDADMEFLRSPELILQAKNQDFIAPNLLSSVYNYKDNLSPKDREDKDRLEVVGNILFFNNTTPARNLLKMWRACRNFSYDAVLSILWNDYSSLSRHAVRFSWLPWQYHTFDPHVGFWWSQTTGVGEDTVAIHDGGIAPNSNNKIAGFKRPEATALAKETKYVPLQPEPERTHSIGISHKPLYSIQDNVVSEAPEAFNSIDDMYAFAAQNSLKVAAFMSTGELLGHTGRSASLFTGVGRHRGYMALYVTANSLTINRVDAGPGLHYTVAVSKQSQLRNTIIVYNNSQIPGKDICGNGNLCVYEYADQFEPDRMPMLPLLWRQFQEVVSCSRPTTLVVARSTVLFRDMMHRHPPQDGLILSTDGVHYDWYTTFQRECPSSPIDLNAEDRPIVGYFGRMGPWLWWDAIETVAKNMPDVLFVFIGADEQRSLSAKMDALARLPNTRLLGSLPFEEIAPIACHWDAAWIPFLGNDTSWPSNSLFDYFALHLPVVATDGLPESSSFEQISTAANTDGFIKAISTVLRTNRDIEWRRKVDATAQAYSWNNIAGSILSAVDDIENGMREPFCPDLY